jgi:hypothetical protein
VDDALPPPLPLGEGWGEGVGLRFSPPRSYGEGPGVGLLRAVDDGFGGLRKLNAPHPLPPPREDGEGKRSR